MQDDGELPKVGDDGSRRDGVATGVGQPLHSVAVQLAVTPVQLAPLQPAPLLHGAGGPGGACVADAARGAPPPGRGHELAGGQPLPAPPGLRLARHQDVTGPAAEAGEGAAHPTAHERLHGLGQGGAQETGRREPRLAQRRPQ